MLVVVICLTTDVTMWVQVASVNIKANWFTYLKLVRSGLQR